MPAAAARVSDAPSWLPEAAAGQHVPSDAEALALAACADLDALTRAAAALRDHGFGELVTYSPKVFVPLTQLCRDTCHYCTFAQVPRALPAPYLSLDEVLAIARRGAQAGCTEVLFTLGDKPELRYAAARAALRTLGFASTLDYLRHAAQRVLEDTGLLPHLNPGTLDLDDLRRLRPVAPSMGLMIESSAERLMARGMPHHGSPDKAPARRLQTLHDAGVARIPFTTGLLIGIGETRRERIETLLAIRRLHQRFGHVQEIIVQNFRAKPGTRMAAAPEPSLDELRWTIAVARLLFGAQMSVQAPPNLSPGALAPLIGAGLNDWGGVSPLTPDFVNPEAPWPHRQALARASRAAGKWLTPRLTIYPHYALARAQWADPALHAPIVRLMDSSGLARGDDWVAGRAGPLPTRAAEPEAPRAPLPIDAGRRALQSALARAAQGHTLSEADLVRLLQARGDALAEVLAAADALRRAVSGDTVSFVVNRNINYTNVCTYKCGFCAFSKGRASAGLRGTAYDLALDEVQRRVREAWARGATEVCMQGGIHPDYTGATYLALLRAARQAVPQMHVHAFSPLEVWHGATTLGLPLAEYLARLQEAGLGTLPGTAAEILDDEIRARICPDKLSTAQWLQVMGAAHALGIKSTATLMFGHVEQPQHVARHLLRIRAQQMTSGGFTEFVPLPFVHHEAPLGLRGQARRGPTLREALLVHAVARLALHPHLTNVQASWVKLGPAGVRAALDAGVNDLGGTLMNESISRAAGTEHGQEMPPAAMRALIAQAGRPARQRSTLYGEVAAEVQARGLAAAPLLPVINTPLSRRRATPVRPPAADTNPAGSAAVGPTIGGGTEAAAATPARETA